MIIIWLELTTIQLEIIDLLFIGINQSFTINFQVPTHALFKLKMHKKYMMFSYRNENPIIFGRIQILMKKGVVVLIKKLNIK